MNEQTNEQTNKWTNEPTDQRTNTSAFSFFFSADSLFLKILNANEPPTPYEGDLYGNYAISDEDFYQSLNDKQLPLEFEERLWLAHRELVLTERILDTSKLDLLHPIYTFRLDSNSETYRKLVHFRKVLQKRLEFWVMNMPVMSSHAIFLHVRPTIFLSLTMNQHARRRVHEWKGTLELTYKKWRRTFTGSFQITAHMKSWMCHIFNSELKILEFIINLWSRLAVEIWYLRLIKLEPLLIQSGITTWNIWRLLRKR